MKSYKFVCPNCNNDLEYSEATMCEGVTVCYHCAVFLKSTGERLTEDEWIELPVDARSTLASIQKLAKDPKVRDSIENVKDTVGKYADSFLSFNKGCPFDQVLSTLGSLIMDYDGDHNLKKLQIESLKIAMGSLLAHREMQTRMVALDELIKSDGINLKEIFDDIFKESNTEVKH